MGLSQRGRLLLQRIDDLTYRQIAVLFLAIGLVVYITGLFNPFQGDDILQIVNNVPVHSITNIPLFFEGSTFYNGSDSSPLVGSYYRPMMVTTFSFIHTVFGETTFFYHLLQLLLCISSAFLIFYILKHLLKSTGIALLVGLLFLVHPINSQVAFSIPSMQDALFFFFGTLGLFFIIRHSSDRDPYWALLSFFLSMLSKEMGILFIVLALVYLFLWNKERIKRFAVWSVLPITVWFLLRLNAIGMFHNPDNAPIDRLDLMGRLLTTPSIIQFFINKFIFPWDLASGYYWTHPRFSFWEVLVPLIIDLLVLCLVIYGGFALRKKASKQLYRSYLFFSVWFLIGLVPILQILPLDMTACETWFYFSTAGLLGMTAVVVMTYKKTVRLERVALILAALILILGGRTLIRGIDWSSSQKLDETNIANSKENYVAYNDLSYIHIGKKQYATSAAYARKSIELFPYFGNYNNLGLSLLNQHDFSGARTAFNKGLSGNYIAVYQNLCLLNLVDGDVDSNRQFFTAALKKFPQNGEIWFYNALFEASHGNNKSAQQALAQATQYGYNVNQTISTVITANQPMTLQVGIGTIELNKVN